MCCRHSNTTQFWERLCVGCVLLFKTLNAFKTIFYQFVGNFSFLSPPSFFHVCLSGCLFGFLFSSTIILFSFIRSVWYTSVGSNRIDSNSIRIPLFVYFFLHLIDIKIGSRKWCVHVCVCIHAHFVWNSPCIRSSSVTMDCVYNVKEIESKVNGAEHRVSIYVRASYRIAAKQREREPKN